MRSNNVRQICPHKFLRIALAVAVAAAVFFFATMERGSTRYAEVSAASDLSLFVSHHRQ